MFLNRLLACNIRNNEYKINIHQIFDVIQLHVREMARKGVFGEIRASKVATNEGWMHE